MDQAALSRTVILSLTFYLTYRTLYPPNRAKSGDKVERSTFLNKNVMRLTPFIIIWLVTPLIIEFIPTFLMLKPDSYDGVCPDFHTHDHNPLNPQFIFGTTSMLIGSSIRLWCYRTLGKYFTFEVTIRSDHKLIKSGPYSIVRHPSYTGFFAMCFGAAVLTWNPEGALTGCGLTAITGVQIIRALWSILMFLFCITVVKRVGGEDNNLRKHFGKEWEIYAGKVRYALIPPIF